MDDQNESGAQSRVRKQQGVLGALCALADARRNGLVYSQCASQSVQVVMEHWSYGVMVSTLDFESSDPGSSPGMTSFWRTAAGAAARMCGRVRECV